MTPADTCPLQIEAIIPCTRCLSNPLAALSVLYIHFPSEDFLIVKLVVPW